MARSFFISLILCKLLLPALSRTLQHSPGILKALQDNQAHLENLSQDIKALDHEIPCAAKELSLCQERRRALEQEIRRIDQEIEMQKRKEADFQELFRAYQEYQENRRNYQKCQKKEMHPAHSNHLLFLLNLSLFLCHKLFSLLLIQQFVLKEQIKSQIRKLNDISLFRRNLLFQLLAQDDRNRKRHGNRPCNMRQLFHFFLGQNH